MLDYYQAAKLHIFLEIGNRMFFIPGVYYYLKILFCRFGITYYPCMVLIFKK